MFLARFDLNISFGLPDPPTKRYPEYSFTRYVATSWRGMSLRSITKASGRISSEKQKLWGVIKQEQLS